MKFLNNMKIKTKLTLLVIFPLMGLLYFSVNSVYNSYTTGVNVQNTNNLLKMSINISALVHETQKERGMTAIFLSSKGTRVEEKLAFQRTLTDKVIEDFIAFNNLLDYERYSINFKSKIAPIPEDTAEHNVCMKKLNINDEFDF